MLRRRVERLSPCPACEGQLFRRLFVKNGRVFWRCTRCHLEKQDPLPTPDELHRYYESAYLSGMYKPFTDAVDLKTHTAVQRFEAVRSYCRPGRWLDVGTSTGVFVKVAREEGVEAEGIDFVQVAVNEANASGTSVHCSTIEEFDPGHRYDTITAFDVLEHVLDPLSFLRSMHRLLHPDGTFAIAVPNQRSWYRRLMGRRWFYYIPEEHMFYYNPECLRALLARSGLEMSHWSSERKPLNLDYALVWSQERSRPMYRLLSTVSALVGDRLGAISVPVPLGDMIVLGRRLVG